jgi:hypothetical protein
MIDPLIKRGYFAKNITTLITVELEQIDTVKSFITLAHSIILKIPW